jgi:hypothetical protein
MVSSMSVPPRSSTPAGEHGGALLGPELDPGALHVVDPAVQQQPRDGVHGPVVALGRARTGDPGEVQRRAGVDERQRHELGEAARPVLQPGEQLQVRDPVVRLVDVPVHHRARRRDAEPVRRGDDLDPGRGRQLALGEHPPDVVVEDLGGRAGQAVDPASRAASRNSSTDSPQRAAPLTTSIGL